MINFTINPAGIRLSMLISEVLLQHSVDVARYCSSRWRIVLLVAWIKGFDRCKTLLHDDPAKAKASSDMGFPYAMEGRRLLGHQCLCRR